MSGKCYYIRMPERGGICTGNYHYGNICNIRQKAGADPIRNSTKLGPIGFSRIAGVTRNDKFGTMFQGKLINPIVIEQFSLFIYPIGDRVVEFTRYIDRAPVSQVPAVGEFIPMIVSPGLRSAWSTAVLAGAPERGCTFT